MDNITLHKSNIKNVIFGKNVTIIEPVNLYDCIIGDNVFIGPFVEIQKGSIVNNNTKISSHSFICSGVTIGEDCFIGHGVMFTNDKFDSDVLNNWILKKTIIGNNVRIGSNSTILPIIIEDNVIIGAGSVVTKNIKSNLIICGNPAKILKK